MDASSSPAAIRLAGLCTHRHVPGHATLYCAHVTGGFLPGAIKCARRPTFPLESLKCTLVGGQVLSLPLTTLHGMNQFSALRAPSLPAAARGRAAVAVVPTPLRGWWNLISALALLSVLAPAIAFGQGLRSGGATVTLVVTKQASRASSVREVELPLIWSSPPTRVTVRVSEESAGGGALFVRRVSGRLERMGGNVIEVPATGLRFRVVELGGGPIPPGRWRVEVRAEGSDSGAVEVVSHTIQVR